MNVNMVSLKLEKLESGHIQVSPISREMVESARLDGKTAWARNLILTEPEVKDAIKCARGEAEYLPWYDDIGHLIRIHPHGIRELYLNSSFGGQGGKYEEYNFNIPGEVLAGWFEDILEDGAVWQEYNEEVFTELEERYGPQWQFVYSDGVVEELLKDLKDERATRLQSSLDGFINIAQNYSDGEEVAIYLSFDYRPRPECPTSYLFSIVHPTRGRIINGGLIAHRVCKNGEELNEWQYSTHT